MRFFAEQAQRQWILFFQRIRWVKEDDVRLLAREQESHGPSHDDAPARRLKGFQILANQVGGVALALDEDGLGCASAKRLNADRTCARIGVQKDYPFNSRSEDIE